MPDSCVLGVDLGGTAIKLGLFSRDSFCCRGTTGVGGAPAAVAIDAGCARP